MSWFQAIARVAVVCGLIALSAWSVPGCSSTPTDPLVTLKNNGASTESRLLSMDRLDALPSDPAYRATMRQLLFAPGVVQPVRAACFDRLYADDREKLLELVVLNLPALEALEWRRGLCEKIAILEWKEATPALVRALGRPMRGWIRDVHERPEYLAIATMYGEGKVGDVVFDVLLHSDPATQANLRARCWELMFELGEEQRLVQLLDGLIPETRDLMLQDLRRGWVELGVLPRTREEVLWLRSLQEPDRKEFWAAAREAMQSVPPEVRRSMQMKDVGVVVAAQQLAPDMLSFSREQMLSRLEAARAAHGGRVFSPDFQGYGGGHSESLHERRKELTWGDAAAILIMLHALQDGPFVEHLFEIAQRDHSDRSTEHGGIVRLDSSGQPELVEFSAASRGSDTQFHASQKMFDASYTAIGHFHLHATELDNERHAGPHMGDFGYADSTGVNGFVFTSLSNRRLNADWYRRGQVVVDLGVVELP